MKAYLVLVSIDGLSVKYYVHAYNSMQAIVITVSELSSSLGDDVEIICKLTAPARN